MPKSSFNLKAVGVGLLMVVVLAGPPVVREFSSIFVSQDERDSSADSRFYVWDAGLRISLDNPLLGVGPWAGEALVPSYYRGEIGDVEGKALHNLFFEMSTGAGIPALILYVLFFAAVFIGHFQLWRSGKWMPSELRTINIAVLCGVPGYLVASVFSSGILIESPYVLVSLGIASVASHGAMCATDIPGLRAESLNADSILSAG
jgi:O-antigen ligase